MVGRVKPTAPAGPPPAGRKEEIAVTGTVIANFPIIAVIVAAMVGVPLWITFKHPQRQPDYAEARVYFQDKEAAEPHVSEFVPSAPVAAVDGLTVARRHLAPYRVVPGRRHATEPTVRTHTRTGQPTEASETR
jgi:hypothetical protein